MNLSKTMWADLKVEYEHCTKCAIGGLAKRHVFGKGNFQPEVLFVGEGPGKLEDVLGLPFVGLAGQLLDQALRVAGGGEGTKDEPLPFKAFFTNLVACRPCDEIGGSNRPPNEEEISNCSDRLKRTVVILSPKIIVALGRVPREVLSEDGFFRQFRVFCLEHPAYILRQGGSKGPAFKNYVVKLKEVVNACLQS